MELNYNTKLRSKGLISGFIFLLALCPRSALSQNWIEIYRPYLSQSVIKATGMVYQLSHDLNSAGLLDPELVYHYITFYNYYLRANPKPDSAMAERLRANIIRARKRFDSLKNAWARKQLILLDSVRVPGSIKDKVRSDFDKLVTRPEIDRSVGSPPAEVDTNRMDFFVVVYYRRRPIGAYDPHEDYRSLRSAIERRERNRLLGLADSDACSPSSFRAVTIGTILREWYMFDPVLSSGASAGHRDQIPETFARLYEREFTLAGWRRYRIGFAVQPYDFGLAGMPMKMGLREYDHEVIFPIEVRNRPGLTLSFGIRKFLHNYLQRFAFLDFTIDYTGFPPSFNDRPVNYGGASGRAGYDSVTFAGGSMANVTFFSISGEVTTPVAIFSNSIFLKAGLVAGWSHASYSFKYDYTHVWGFPPGSSDPVMLTTTGDGTLDQRYDRIILSPVVELEAAISRRLSADVRLYYRYAGLSLVYGI